MSTFYNVVDLVRALMPQLAIEDIRRILSEVERADDPRCKTVTMLNMQFNDWENNYEARFRDFQMRWFGGRGALSEVNARTILRNFFAAKRCGYFK